MSMYLLDYKGKFEVLSDTYGENDIVLGEISRDEAIDQAYQRVRDANYFGVPAIMTDDEELRAIYALYEEQLLDEEDSVI